MIQTCDPWEDLVLGPSGQWGQVLEARSPPLMGKPLRFCLHPTVPPCCLQFSHFFPLLPQIFYSPRCLSATEGQRQVSGFEDTAIATSIPLDEGPVWQDNHLGGILMKLCQELGDILKKDGDGEYTNFQITKNAFWQMRNLSTVVAKRPPTILTKVFASPRV